MAPQVWAMRERLVVDVDYVVRLAPWYRRPWFNAGQFQDSGRIAIQAKLSAAGEHAIAFSAVDDSLADLFRAQARAGRNIVGGDIRAAIRGTADHRLHATTPRGDNRVE